jgi:hypothetical protein
MPDARFLPLSRRRLLGVVSACTLACAGWGCQQPPCYTYYGYGVPPCAPAVPSPAAVTSGPVCDVPTRVVEGGTTTADASGRSTVVSGSQNPSPRVVVSEPVERRRPFWRPADPDATLATTSVEGAVSDSSVNR